MSETQKPLFVLIAKLAEKDGVVGISKLPGLYEKRVGATWKIAVNGHKNDIEWPQTNERMGCRIPPFHCAVMYNGWLAGLFGPYGGIIATHPSEEGANEKNFAAALERAIAS